MHLYHVFLLVVVSTVLVGVYSTGTQFDNSLKPPEEKVKTSRAHKSIADIISKAAGKIEKTRTKPTVEVEVKQSKRKLFVIIWLCRVTG